MAAAPVPGWPIRPCLQSRLVSPCLAVDERAQTGSWVCGGVLGGLRSLGQTCVRINLQPRRAVTLIALMLPPSPQFVDDGETHDNRHENRQKRQKSVEPPVIDVFARTQSILLKRLNLLLRNYK